MPAKGRKIIAGDIEVLKIQNVEHEFIYVGPQRR